MALRVLLADNSDSIRKAIEVSLKSFAVDVKSVTTGLDVIEVAKSFKPDIVLVDILLQKRNGYEVTQDLKNEATTKSIPVILMWSNFIEIDEAKAKESGADGRIEKPFDQEAIQSLIESFVQTKRENPLEDALEMPSPPSKESESSASEDNGGLDFLEMPEKTTPTAPPPIPDSPTPPIISDEVTEVPPSTVTPEADDELSSETKAPEIEASEGPDEKSWNMESFEDIKDFEANLPNTDDLEDGEDFQQVPLGTLPDTDLETSHEGDSENDSQSDESPSFDAGAFEIPETTDQFEVDIPENDFEGVTVNIKEPEEEITDASFLMQPGGAGEEPQPAPVVETTPEPEQASEIQSEEPKTSSPPPAPEVSSSSLSIDEQREIFERKMEKAINELVPEIATKLIKAEIDRLLQDKDQ